MTQPKPWDSDHPDAELLDEAVSLGISIDKIAEISSESELHAGRRLRNKEREAIDKLVFSIRYRRGDYEEKAPAVELATPRQVDYIADLLNRRRRQGEGGGWADDDSYYLPDGRVNLVKIRKMTKQGASGLISSLRQDY